MSADASHEFTLVIVEQPAKLHRFRYLKEIKDGRMGSILHSRNSSKTPVKVRVTRNHHDVSSECRVRLICCTVFEDLMSHPFYLFGDNCSGGIFEKDITLSAGKSECVVSLDRIGIVCTPKKQNRKKPESENGTLKSDVGSNEVQVKPRDATGKSEILQGDDNIERRHSTFNIFEKPPRKDPFKGKDIDQLKLAFQLYDVPPGDTKTWTALDCKPVASETIKDAKIYSELTVDYVNPKTVTRRDQDVWLYMKDPLPGIPTNFKDEKEADYAMLRFEVSFENSELGIPLSKMPVKKLKQHLVVFNFKNATGEAVPDDADICLRVWDKATGESSQSVTLQLQLQACDEPASKKQRTLGADNFANAAEPFDSITCIANAFDNGVQWVLNPQGQEASPDLLDELTRSLVSTIEK